jgi:hypothetical protein
MPDLDDRLGRRQQGHALEAGGQAQRFRNRQGLGRRNADRSQVAVVGDAQVGARVAFDALLPDDLDADARHERSHAQEGGALRVAGLGQVLAGRIPHADARVSKPLTSTSPSC